MSGIDKLDAVVAGRPVLAWAVDSFARIPAAERIVLVAAADRVARYRSASWLPDRVTAVVAGGPRRQESVAAGVRWLRGSGVGGGGPEPANTPEDRVVLVHDGARPHGLARSHSPRRPWGRPSWRGRTRRARNRNHQGGRRRPDRADLDRSRLAAAQTPQGVRYGLLERAWARFRLKGRPNGPMKAALLEACTITVHAISGDPSNLKVTLPSDLSRVEHVLGGDLARSRVGFGSDTHPFGPGRPLALGGVAFPDAPRLSAIPTATSSSTRSPTRCWVQAARAISGACFRPDARTPKGVASRRAADAVVERVRRRLRGRVPLM